MLSGSYTYWRDSCQFRLCQRPIEYDIVGQTGRPMAGRGPGVWVESCFRVARGLGLPDRRARQFVTASREGCTAP